MITVKGSTVFVPEGQNQFEKAMRKFKKKVQASNKLVDLQQREHYIKPTTRRKLKAAAARARWRKYLSAQELPKKEF